MFQGYEGGERSIMDRELHDAAESGLIEIDGAEGEGGGQMLRTSLALSLVTRRAFRLRNIRARRSSPGLRPQHLASVRAAAVIGQAHVVGDRLGSTDLAFTPGKVCPGRYRFPIGTAGATSLLLQAIYLPLLRCTEPSDLLLEGGTHVRASPSFHYLMTTWSAYLTLLGAEVRLTMHRPGFYPRGGGCLQATIAPCPRIRPLQLLERGQIERLDGTSAVAGLPQEIANRQARRAESRLQRLGLRSSIQIETWEGGPGTMLALYARCSPVSSTFVGLGERGKPAERVADEAVDALTVYLERAPAALEPHAADQIVLPLALAEGASEFSVSEVTLHLRTNLDVIAQFVPRRFVCEGELGQPGRVCIE
jgi:RNA 3'-terminal phosphate cyclase (ATP)